MNFLSTPQWKPPSPQHMSALADQVYAYKAAVNRMAATAPRVEPTDTQLAGWARTAADHMNKVGQVKRQWWGKAVPGFGYDGESAVCALGALAVAIHGRPRNATFQVQQVGFRLSEVWGQIEPQRPCDTLWVYNDLSSTSKDDMVAVLHRVADHLDPAGARAATEEQPAPEVERPDIDDSPLPDPDEDDNLPDPDVDVAFELAIADLVDQVAGHGDGNGGNCRSASDRELVCA